MNADLPDAPTPPTEAPAPAPAADVPAEGSAAPAEAARDVTAELKALFPALFTGKPRPVKLRIQADIQERAPGRFSKAQLSAFLRRHTGSTGYLIALTQAKTRFDLDGQPAGEISEEHLAAAREELARRRGLKQEREQLEMQQRRNRAQLLWDFERTTLTEANFCALKGLSVEELPGVLEMARKERAEAPPAPVRHDRREGPRAGAREGRADDRRGPRPAGPRGDSRGDSRGEGRSEGRSEGRGGPRPDGRRGPPREERSGDRRAGGRPVGAAPAPRQEAAAPAAPTAAPVEASAAAPSAPAVPDQAAK